MRIILIPLMVLAILVLNPSQSATSNESRPITVRFMIYPDGRLDKLKLWRSSGCSIADEAALKAVVDSAPFKPLPAGVLTPIAVEFKFDYCVFCNCRPYCVRVLESLDDLSTFPEHRHHEKCWIDLHQF